MEGTYLNYREQNSIPMDILIFYKAKSFYLRLHPPRIQRKISQTLSLHIHTYICVCVRVYIPMITSKKACSNWLCTNKSKNMVVKIVHPGGHVELHDRPILAAEIMFQNPKCYVAHPHVFQQPWATVEPETMLMPGQKFYVVPNSTLRKLQRFALKYSPLHHLQTSSTIQEEPKEYGGEKRENIESPCSDFSRTNSGGKDVEQDGSLCGAKYCLFFWVLKARGNGHHDLSNTVGSYDENKRLISKRTMSIHCSFGMRGNYKRFAFLNQNWQPNLESISEE